MGDVHNRTRYLAGCRCDTCKKAQSEYRRDLRRRKNAEKAGVPAPQSGSLSAVPPPRSDPPDAPAAPDEDSVEAQVRREIEGFATAEEKPGRVAMAIALARLLDNPAAYAQHSAAVARLNETMAILERGGRKKRGKLAAVKEMTAS